MAIVNVVKQRRTPFSSSGNRYAKSGSLHLHSKKIPNFFAWLITVFTGLVFIVIITLGLLFAYRFVTTSSFFATREIAVSGNSRLGYAELLEIAGMQTGMNSFAVNMGAVEQRLLRNPWVKFVSVKRQLPDTFKVVIHEYEPAYWVRREQGMMYADASGMLIDSVGPAKFSSYPVLSVEEGAEVLQDRLVEFVGGIATSGLPLDVRTASWVKLSLSRGVELFFEGSGLTLNIGVEDWPRNLKRLGAVLTDLSRRGELKRVRNIKVQGTNVWVRTQSATLKAN